jgi:hypothetical protein
MKYPCLIAVLILTLSPRTTGKEKQKEERLPPAPVGWICLEKGTSDLLVPQPDFQKDTRHLMRGTICPVYKLKEKRGAQWAQVRAFNFDTGITQTGWLETNQARILPIDTYPADAEVLRALGAPFLDDFAADHTDVTRFLVHQGQAPPALVCFVFGGRIAIAKLVVFTRDQGKYLPGPPVDFSLNELNSGISSVEIRDLLGNGNECLITREPFQSQMQIQGANVVIRRIEGDKLVTVWKAPVEFRNLSQYRAKMQILEPPEGNIGAPGTITTGEVTYRPRGSGEDPVWKGKVEFFVLGREKALDSVPFEKACPWNGKEFTPLQ